MTLDGLERVVLLEEIERLRQAAAAVLPVAVASSSTVSVPLRLVRTILAELALAADEHRRRGNTTKGAHALLARASLERCIKGVDAAS